MDSAALRSCLGRFATGVCVVSAADADGAPCGMTVNSFTAVSLEPPLILWNIQRRSSCYEMLANATWFAVNVLRLEQQQLAERCSRHGGHRLLAEELDTEQEQRAPLVRNALTVMLCRQWRKYDGGDHEIIVGLVERIYSSQSGAPLLYYGSDYGAMADA